MLGSRNAISLLAPVLLTVLAQAAGSVAQAPSSKAATAAAGAAPMKVESRQPLGKSAGKTLLDIVLEKKTASGVRQMRQEHVFETGDIIRFRVASRYNGYMYVMDQGTSGKFSTVFPSAEAGRDNRMIAGSAYVVPASSGGWFKIEGPAGFDVLYFLLSPVAIAPASAPARQQSFVSPGPPSSLKPRCDDAIFKARGECMDPSAGPGVLPPDAAIPAPLQSMAGSASRDMTFSREGDNTTVASNAGSAAPVIYTFHVAHR